MKFCYLSNLVPYDWQSIFSSYKKKIKKTDTVLEIGASNINNTKQLAKHCKKIIGIELFPERTPENFANVKYKVGDWQKLSKLIPKNSIDIAISTHVIEHIPDDLQAVNELYIVLKLGGVAFLNTPNRKRLTRSMIEFFSGERKFPHQEHQREYTETDLLSLLKKSKFKKYKIIPVVLGLHAGPLYIFKEKVPRSFRNFANFWEIHLFK